MKALPNLAVLGALAMNWLNTTHGNALGHDHHCPVRTGENPWEPQTKEDAERCTCGWATFYRQYLEMIKREETPDGQGQAT